MTTTPSLEVADARDPDATLQNDGGDSTGLGSIRMAPAGRVHPMSRAAVDLTGTVGL